MGEAVEKKPHKMNVDQELALLFHHNKQEPHFKLNESESSVNETHSKVISPWNFKICDIDQKVFILVNNRLVATRKISCLSGHVMTVLPNPTLDSKKYPVFLGLKNRSHILFCEDSGEDLPRLQLVTGDIMDLYEKNEESLEFTFYIRADGSKTTCCFESAAYPGWFLSTSPEPNRPVGLSKQGGTNIVLFYLERKMDSE